LHPIYDSVDHAPDQHSSGIPDAPRRAGWIGESLAVVLAGIHARYLQHQTGEGFQQDVLVVPALVARAHQVLDADDRTS
jgi:hypothetical protein